MVQPDHYYFGHCQPVARSIGEAHENSQPGHEARLYLVGKLMLGNQTPQHCNHPHYLATPRLILLYCLLYCLVFEVQY